jgi:Amt family ammonium transporter
MEIQSVQSVNQSVIVLALNQFYLLIMGILVFSMQLGFTLLEAGAVRKKNVNNILTKVKGFSY